MALKSRVQQLQRRYPPPLPEADLVRHPAWIRVRTVLMQALAPFPEAGAAVAAALLAAENEESRDGERRR